MSADSKKPPRSPDAFEISKKYSRVLFSMGDPDGEPVFQLHIDINLEVRQRALTLFQQAARKVVIRCRMQRRLTSLKKLADVKDKTCDLLSPDNILPPFPTENNPMALRNLVALPVDPIDVTVTAHIPFFKLQVPQHYQLMAYWPVSAWEAFNSCIPATLARPLPAGAPEAQEPVEDKDEIIGTKNVKVGLNEEEPVAAKESVAFSFSAPADLLRPVPANPLRIFNPAPGLRTYKPKPKYLESDLEIHLCPLQRYEVFKSSSSGFTTRPPQPQFLHHEEVIVKGRKSDSNSLFSDSNSLPTSSPRRSVDYNTDILPLSAPPAAFPDEPPALPESWCEDPGIQLTPEMIRAEFLLRKAPVSNSNLPAPKRPAWM